MGNQVRVVDEKIASFKKKYYLNLFLRGSILTLSLLLAYFLLATLVEYNLWLGKEFRLLIFILFFGVVAYCLFQFLRQPLAWWLTGKGMGKEQSASIIGRHFPSIQDRLLNFLQLSAAGSGNNVLVEASLEQKAAIFGQFSFESIIDLGENRRYLKYLAIPFLLFAGILVFNQNIFTQSADRIIHFNQEFSPQAPFKFEVVNESLQAFPNEDFLLNIKLDGEAVPDAAYLVAGPQRLKMERTGAGDFSYLFEKIQQDLTFQIEAAGFYSNPFTIKLVSRPELLNLKVQLIYPPYTGRQSQQLFNAGNLEVPEGTRIKWRLNAANALQATILFSSGTAPESMQQSDNQTFEYGRNFNNPDEYSISLENENSKNKDKIAYRIDVIKDQYPSIIVRHLKDSVLFKSIVLAGQVEDDYAVSKLDLHFVITHKDKEEKSSVISLTIEKNQQQQNFFYNWTLDSLKLDAGDRLEYYLEVWDNDGVHGHKSTKSAAYQFLLPSEEEFKSEIKRSQSSTESELQRSLNKAKSLKDQIEQAEQKLRGKQSLDWQDKKMLEDLLQQKHNLDDAVKDLQEKNKMLEEKKNAFSEQNERIREKSEQIQKLMNELLDDETKKLFEELEKMLKENQDPSQIQKMLEKMERQEINIEKELERTLELFKQLQYDYKLDQAIREIGDQAEKQKDILEKTQELAGEKKDPKDGKDGEKNKDGKDAKDNKGKNEEKGDQDQNDADAKDGEKNGDQKDGEKGDQKDGKDGKDGEKGEKDEPTTEEQLAQEQEELEKQADDFKKTLDDLNKMGEELDKQESTPSEQDINEMKEQQKQSKESLQQKNSKKATAPQKKSLQKMQQMKDQLEGMQNSMEMEIDQQNLESLRQIIHGLIKLSYDQESLMKDFNSIQQSDPKYIQLSQNQLKIKDDSKVLEDSLLALSKKDPFMGSVVTREIGELNEHLDKSVENIRERRKSNASTDMQLSMTGINNLALMLNDHFDMMMDMMANAMPSMGKKKQKGQSKSLGEMQQRLNQQIEQIKNSGKSGRQLSEELARMAAEQERIRRALNEMQEKMKQEGGKAIGGDLPGKMEQTEMDLVNKQITEQTIKRQKEILTRLLESEKSMREQELDEERKGETAKDYQKEIPKAFEEYLRLKEKEVELLKTVPPKLYPYYKKEVNEYFKRLGTQK